MPVVVITGSAGLIGSEASRFFAKQGFEIVGLDNNLRQVFFGADASTEWNRNQLESELGKSYHHYNVDIRDSAHVSAIFSEFSSDIALVIHTAAQPSHDWAARDPQMDFTVNANGTLNLLEATRQFSIKAPFIFTSTNKVYGATPNELPLFEQELRWEIDPTHRYAQGIGEDMSIDRTLHSLFGASKVAADVLVQEYGRYFGMLTACFRGGCLTGPNHSGAQLHGFLAYLMKCTMTHTPYTIFGYKGKQVRDNIHSADLIAAFTSSSSRREAEKFTTSAAAALAIARCSKPFAFAKRSPERSSITPTSSRTGPAIISGGSATLVVFRSTIRTGNSSTTFRESWARFTNTIKNAGAKLLKYDRSW